MKAADLLPRTTLTDDADLNLDRISQQLTALKAENAPVDDPRVVSAISQFAKALTEKRLAARVASAMGSRR
jgi:hypothetical protein